MAGLKQDYWQNYVDGNWVDGGAAHRAARRIHAGQIFINE